MSILVVVEHDNQTAHSTTLQVIAAAMQLKASITACVIGYQCQNVAKEVSEIKGVERIICVDHINYEHALAEHMSLCILDLAKDFEHILMASTTFGKNILPRAAALLGVMQISDVTRILSSDTFERPIYAGNAIETIQSMDAKKVMTIRATAFEPILEKQSAVQIQMSATAYETRGAVFVEHATQVSNRPELTKAKYVVSGGRGLQNKEQFKLVEELADVLGAAVGASRAAVDAGFIANDHQVGQTGKIVAPALYIALGISGAIQHIAGMKDSKVIVAINKDEDAPIFQYADYGLVGDLFTIVPELIEALKNRS